MSDLLTELGRSEDPEFEDAWAAKWSGPEADTQTDEPEAEAPAEADTVEEPQGQPRDEQGRFTRVDQPEVDEHAHEAELEAEERQEAQAEETAAESDPVEALLAKYGGDVGAALRAAAEAQSLIGRKETQRSQAEAEAQELRQRIEQLEQRQPQAATPTRTITEADVEALDQAVVEGRGRQALEMAAQLDPSGMLAKRVLDSWAAVSPGEATVYVANQIAEQRMAAMREELAPIKEENARSQADQAFVNDWNALVAAKPEVEQLVPAINQILDEDEELAKTILNSSGSARVSLLKTVADAAKVRQEPHVQEAIAEFEKERAEASREAKTTAKVTAPKAQIGSPPGGGGEPEKTQAQREGDAIKAKILDAPDTSISSGWTTE